MLLDELLIKIGVEADDAAIKQFTQALEAMGKSSNEFAERLGSLLQGMEELSHSAQEIPEAEAIEKWNEKAREFGELIAEYGDLLAEDFDQLKDVIEETSTSTEGLGESANNATDNERNLREELEKLKKIVEQQTKANEENKESIENLTTSIKGYALAKLGLEKIVEGVKKKFSALRFEMNKIPTALGILGAAFGAAVYGITKFIDSNLTALDEIRQLSNVTKETVENIQLLGKVAELNGSSSEAVQASIAGLSKVIGEAANGTGLGAKAFEKFGFSARKANGDIKSSSDMLEEIRQKMQGLNEQQQIAMLAKLGIDASMIQTLRLSNEAMKEALANAKALSLGTGTEENADEAAAFKDAMTELNQMITGVRETIALRLSPAIREIIERFKQWFLTNNELIKNTLAKFGNVIAGIIGFVTDLVTAVSNIITSTIGWDNALLLLGARIVWLSRRMLIAFATNPFAWAIAGITALLFLVEDFIGFLDGKESLLGDFWQPFADGWKVIKIWLDKAKTWIDSFIKGWQKSINVLEPLKQAFSMLWTTLENIWGSLSRIFKRIFNISDTTGDWASESEATGETLAHVFNFVTQVIEGIAVAIAIVTTALGGTFEIAGSVVVGVFNVIKAVWDGLVESWTSGDWLSAFKKVFSRLGNIATDVWHNIKVAAIEFVNGLIAIVNKFGAGIEPIEIPIKQTVETIGEKTASVANMTSSVAKQGVEIANLATVAPQIAAQGAVNNNQKTDNSQKNSNNKITITQHIQSNNADAKAVADQSARAVGNQLSPIMQ